VVVRSRLSRSTEADTIGSVGRPVIENTISTQSRIFLAQVCNKIRLRMNGLLLEFPTLSLFVFCGLAHSCCRVFTVPTSTALIHFMNSSKVSTESLRCFIVLTSTAMATKHSHAVRARYYLMSPCRCYAVLQHCV